MVNPCTVALKNPLGKSGRRQGRKEIDYQENCPPNAGVWCVLLSGVRRMLWISDKGGTSEVSAKAASVRNIYE